MDKDPWFLERAQEYDRRAAATRDKSLRYLYELLARQWRQLADEAAKRQAA
jgi:hypothetical protein